jgi:hypothetical protein
MVGLCRLEIRNSNQKSLPILGLIANILAQRTGGCSDAGGEGGIRTHGTARVVDNPLTSKAGMGGPH